MSSSGTRLQSAQGPTIIPLWWILAALCALMAALKLSLIGFNQGEYTDGIIQLNLWTSQVVFFPPGYSALVWLFDAAVNDLLISGRLVSIAASIAALPLMFILARDALNDDRAALWATLFLALSPIYTRWSLRVMTDSLFLPLFIAGCILVLRALNGRRGAALALIGLSGLSALVRYQGIYFLPWALVCLMAPEIRSRTKPAALWRWPLAALPWLILASWIAFRGFGHVEQFTDRASFGFWVTALAYFNSFESYILYWPWAITHSLFAIGVIGWICLANQNRSFSIFALITALVFLAVQSAFLSFQYRYLLPLLPLWCVAAGQGWLWLLSVIQRSWLRSTLTGLALANLILMSSAVLFLQQGGAFGDIAQAGGYFQSVWKDARLLSNDVYRQGVYCQKISFWSGREVLFYHETEPKAGDIVLLHNVYGDQTAEIERLRQAFQVSKLGDWRSMSVPLLPEIMVTPPGLTSNPEAMGFRFAPQHYYTVAVRLEPKP